MTVKFPDTSLGICPGFPPSASIAPPTLDGPPETGAAIRAKSGALIAA